MYNIQDVYKLCTVKWNSEAAVLYMFKNQSQLWNCGQFVWKS